MRKLTKKDIKGNVIIVPMTENLDRNDYIKIGYNSGTFGWNWSAYKKAGERYTWYIQGYRNFPQGIYVDSNGRNKKFSKNY